MIQKLVINGTPLSDFGVYFDGSKQFVKPAKDIEFVSIPGRNGDLSFSNKRFENVEITFPCFIRNDFVIRYPKVLTWLSSLDGYVKIETSQDPEYYREGQFIAAVSAETTFANREGFFELTFNCRPQKFLKSGQTDVPFSGSQTIMNHWNMIAKPLFKVTGTGYIAIGSNRVTLSTNTGTTFIDCEIQDAYQGSINRNPNITVTNGWPELAPGLNTVTVSGFSSVTMTPRWWAL